jgi:hypothetical protein
VVDKPTVVDAKIIIGIFVIGGITFMSILFPLLKYMAELSVKSVIEKITRAELDIQDLQETQKAHGNQIVILETRVSRTEEDYKGIHKWKNEVIGNLGHEVSHPKKR